MKRFSILIPMTLVALALTALLPSGLAAQDDPAPAAAPEGSPASPQIDETKTPWLKGVTIPNKPDHPSPVLKAEILMANGSPIPATLSEDVGVLMMVDTDIFAEKPPTEWNGQSLPNAQWAGQPSVRWFFDDVAKNQSTLASCSEQLPSNQMKVTPLNPCRKGGVTVTLARPMTYEESPGKVRRVFANSSTALNVRVTDITPPTSGLELSVGDQKGTFWAAENPPHKHPLPKMADVYLKGPLFSPTGQDEQVVVPGIELGDKMILTPDQGQLRLPKTGELKIQLALQDNEEVDAKSVTCGLCELADGKPVPVAGATGPTIDLAKVKLPAQPYIFIEAKDLTGNRQVLCIPVTVK
ncbi:MAG: hypothetical protein GX442_17750 [Candidatus Riflebacteria bacterium]|nr:hypothetical protein [Candidatus Riflebacteria bacterium]